MTGSCVAGQAAGLTGAAPNQLYSPYSILFDSNNSLYIADEWNNRIQKWPRGATTGVTVAGLANGTAGASSSALHYPVGMVMDVNGNLYFTDRENHRVMYWANGASSGITIAGTTGKINTRSQTLWNERRWRILLCIHVFLSGTSGAANNQFDTPSGLVRIPTNGTLYIADTFNHRIMQYLANASLGTVVAGGNGGGTGSTQLNRPYSFAFDSSSNSFLIANYFSHNVVRWVLGASSWTLIAGVTGSPGATSTMLSSPLSVTLDCMGNMYIADSDNHRIQLFLAGQSNGTTIAGVTGSLGNTSNQLNFPYWAILDNQLNLYVADTLNNRVQRFQLL